ncbi:MAG: zinc finger Ran-binding domain-containing protein [Methanobrevibacter sp.]|nr:zinc finger Ran-binding domain-containing protein [Methanobrevibacter sp.]
MVKCPRCGYDNSSSSTYCVNCSYILKGSSTGKKKGGWNMGTGKKIVLIVGIIIIAFLLFSIINNFSQPTNKESLNVIVANNNTQEGSSTPYQVKIIYNGTWYAKYGDPNYLQEKSGSGEIVISLDCAAWDAVHVSVQKTDASSENLTVQILRNGEVVAVNSTTSPNGGVKLNYQN